jgi:RNA polymerase sigma-70 factor (ECF subfamily)
VTHEKTSASLLERLRQPADPGAWDRFVSLYAPLIYTWGRHVGLQDQDAADLVQEVFVKLVEVLPTFHYDAHKKFRGWLRTVTLNTWRDRGKRRGTRPLPGDDVALAELAAPDNPDSFWEAAYRREVVHRALTLMKADFQPATWKAFWEQAVVGRPAREVASELGLSAGAVYAAKLRVLTRLREELQGLLE